MRGTVTALRRVSRVNLPALAVLLALLMAISPALFAQEASGGITGKVTDPSGAAVVGADVITRDVDRGTVWTTKTNEGGVYNFARLPIGRYEVKVQATGFQAALRTAFPLELNQTAKIDLALTLGAVSQQVEVSDAVPALQTQTTEVSTVMQSGVHRQPAAGDAQLQPAHAADSRRGHHQSRVVQYGAEDVQRRAPQPQRESRAGQLLPAGRHREHRVRR